MLDESTMRLLIPDSRKKRSSGTDRQIGASFDRFERAISAVLMLAFSSEANF
jgi:hypothetical protein